MLEYRLDENDERQRYREQILLFLVKLQLYLIHVVNDFYDRILKINKKNENLNTYREILKNEQIIVERTNLQKYIIKNEIFYKHDKF